MPILGSIVKRAIELRSKMPREKRLYPDPGKIQRRTLKRLLRKSQLTSFGEHFKFTQMLEKQNIVSEFKKAVPVYDYNSIFKEWWYRSINGESFVTWPGTVKYFALSSGTSESSSKYIPVTGDMLRAIKKTSTRQIFSLAKYDFPKEFYERGILMLGGSTHLQYNGTYYAGDLSGITTNNIPFWFQHFYKPGKRISKERDWSTKLDEIVKNAPNWDIGIVVGVPAWIQILIEKIIERYNLKTIHDIWPNLNIYVHGGVAFTPYKMGFQKLLERPITYIETYLSSEGFIAYQNRPNTESMAMVLDNGIFYEFVPFNQKNFDEDNNVKPDAETLTIEQVEENTQYALLISTSAGAWRYLIGDTITFTSKERSEIKITGRTKHFLNICGEHLSQDNMNRAVEMLEKELDIEVREFTVSGIKHETMFAHKWFIGTNSDVDPSIAKEKIDDYLKVLNDDYRVERIEAIRDVFVEIVKPDLFYAWLKKNGKEGSQIKFPRVIKKEQRQDWEAFIKEQSNN